ncbi:TPA: hypothetical protein J0U32_000542 [Enterococcus faecium]|nr:hypothetical protein [Enterococcus faecium]HAQ6648191.1 hypothetical protein [Enterococcus faecium]HAQ6892634.1 hypothetical protein [Enterococcus faecium]HAQ7559148.1 hypothetical protein [Enterococcus faecium]HAQ7962702.1 hypothetical protein [Enterococcus faecium]
MIVAAMSYHLTGNSNVASLIAVVGVVYAIVKACNNEYLAIWVMFVLGSDIWGIVPYINIGSGVLHWSDFNVIVAILLCLRFIKVKARSRYGIVYSVMLIFILIACVQSHSIYGQDVHTTLLTARELLVVISFWPIVKIVYSERITKNEFIDLVCKFTRWTMCIYWFEWILVNMGFNITFLQTGARWGTRIYIDPIFIILYFFINLYAVIYKRESYNSTNKSIWNCIFSLLTFVIISQGRSGILYVVITSVIMLLISLKPSKIIRFGILGIALIACLVSVTQIREVVISSFVESQSSDTGNIAYRIAEQDYFENKLEGHELFGVGIPNNHDARAVEYSGKTIDFESKKYNPYYLEDLGAFEIRYRFGIIAYALYIVALAISIIDAGFRRDKSVAAFAGMAFMVFMALNFNLLAYITARPFGFMISLILIEISAFNDEFIYIE